MNSLIRMTPGVTPRPEPVTVGRGGRERTVTSPVARVTTGRTVARSVSVPTKLTATRSPAR